MTTYGKKEFKCLTISLLITLLLILTSAASTQVLFERSSVSSVAASQSPLASAPLAQQDTQDVIRIDTNLVTIPAVVMDRDGRYITDLRKEDFRIFEDGVEHEVAFFAPVERPFTVLFLLDVSGSMSYRMDDLARAANSFVTQLRPDDQLIAMSFCDRIKVLVKGTTKAELQNSKGFKLQQCGSTRLYYAVESALKRMRKLPGRKAILLFSDGYDSGGILDPFTPNVTAKDNFRDAEEEDTLIYTVQFQTPATYPPRYARKERVDESIQAGEGYMRALAQKTGGRYYEVEDISDLRHTFGLVADELRRQYSLGYYPKIKPEAGQKRQIRVKVRVPNLVVRARETYIVDKNLRQAK